jgi:hypothetical protein
MSPERVGFEGKPPFPRLGCGHESPEEADVLVARAHRPRDASPGRGSTSGCSTSPNNQNLAKPHGQANRQLASLRSHAGPARSRQQGQPQLPLTLLSGSVGVVTRRRGSRKLHLAWASVLERPLRPTDLVRRARARYHHRALACTVPRAGDGRPLRLTLESEEGLRREPQPKCLQGARCVLASSAETLFRLRRRHAPASARLRGARGAELPRLQRRPLLVQPTK